MTIRSSVRDAARRVYSAVSRGTLVKADDQPKWQEAEIRGEHGQRYKKVEVAQPYGFAFWPKPPESQKSSEAAEVIIFFPDASRSHPIVVAIGDRRYRLEMKAPGESALYDDQGQQVYIARDRIVVHSDKEIHAQRGDAHVLLSGDKAKMQKGDMSVTCKGGKVYLGKEDVPHKVITSGGESEKVFCAVSETDSPMQAATVAEKVK